MKKTVGIGGVVIVMGLIISPITYASGTAATVEALVTRAGNMADDGERLALLREMAADQGLPEDIRLDASRMADEVERWLTEPDLPYFNGKVLKEGAYDFGVKETSPLFPLTLLYQARMRVWVVLEHGGYWSIPEERRKQLDPARVMFEQLRERFPENPIVRMYLGEAIPWVIERPEIGGAPDWAIAQREGLERLAAIIRWWIRHRMQENCEYGGGWGDDCEMWRWWTPVLIAFEDPEIVDAQARFSRAILSQPHMAGGYTSHVYDVEHTAEDSADALTPMMHLEPGSDEWAQKALRLAELMRNLWTGVNERGFLQFRSTYFSSEKVNDEPRKACDTVQHPRAVQPLLLYWQRTRDPEIGAMIRAWMDTWVDATAREEKGKPAGVIPAAIHWPEGFPAGLGARWWDPENHDKDPLYVWPGAMPEMTQTLVLTHFMTGEAKYLEPVASMARVRLKYLLDSPEQVEEGSELWCGSRMRGVREAAEKYKIAIGGSMADELLMKEASPYMAFQLTGERAKLIGGLKQIADSFSTNFAGYTSEVRYTDRVLRFPALFGSNGMYENALQGFPVPEPSLLYATATGDPGNALYFPINAVRWLTPPDDIAALVTKSGQNGFEAEVFHFGENPRFMGMELYLLKPGRYQFSITPEASGYAPMETAITVEGARTRVSLTLPPRVLCRVLVKPL